MKYWLLKSEPNTYSISDLERDGETSWEGVRNYSARNNMRAMEVGDLGLFYHSNANPPGVAGICKIKREAYPDHYAWNTRSKYYDEKSPKEKPRWFMVDVQYQRKLKRNITLQEIRTHPALADLLLVRKGNRLSVMPVTGEHWEYILGLE
jgi:predicted RNA-binding protein with PUA-like domain